MLVDHSLKYGPYLWFTLRLTYLTYEKREEIRNPLVDLVNGKVINYEIPGDLLKPGSGDSKLIYRRKLSYKQAYQRLQTAITDELKYSDPTWAITATEKLSNEKKQLEDFYSEMPNQEKRQLRINELMERAQPRVQVRPLRAALLYLPKLEYRVMHVNNGHEKTNRIIYDPVSSQYELKQ